MNRTDISTEEILKGTYRESRVFSALTMGTIGVMEAVMIVFSIVNASFYLEEYLNVYRAFYVFLLSMVILYFLMKRYINKDYDRRYRIQNVMNPLYIAIFYIWAMGITYNDLKIYGSIDPTLFMTFSLTLPVCLYVPFQLYDILAVVADAAMLYLTVAAAGSPGVAINLAIFFVFQLVVGNSLLISRRNLALRFLRMEKQKKEIEELSRSQSRFFSAMSHEIRTPINTIIGLDELILRENASGEVNENALHIRAAGKMLLSLINDILDMSKVKAGMMEFTDMPYTTVDMFEDIWGMLRIQAEEKGLDLKMKIAGDIPSRLSGDEVRIKQILINLMNNAIKYTKLGYVRLTVSCEKTDDGMVTMKYEVSDSGIGIREEHLPYLFTPYKRLGEIENRYIEGTGLGLSIVRQLCDLMKGSVGVSSVYGEGTTFTVCLPQKIVDDHPVGEVDLTSFGGRGGDTVYAGTVKAPKARVLVVDDAPANLYVIRKLLAHTGVMLDTVESGSDALFKTAEFHYHVIFMDHLMPGMDGIETLHAIREQSGGKCRDSKIVMLTANVMSENIEMYKKEGFDGILSKPIEPKDLEVELMRLIPEEFHESGTEGETASDADLQVIAESEM